MLHIHVTGKRLTQVISVFLHDLLNMVDEFKSFVALDDDTYTVKLQ